MSLHIDCTIALQHFVLQAKLTLPSHGISAIVGESGSGKTTLLEAIAGLRHDGATTVVFQGRPLQLKQIGLVLQQPQLFPHLSVEQNLRYGWQRATAHRIGWDEVIAACGLQDLLQQRPAQLSGGQQQRVAFARAILGQPQLLLLDEPFSALDEPTRHHFVRYLRTLTERYALPIVWVSHQLTDVVEISDYLVVLHAGQVRQSGLLQEQLKQEPLRSQVAVSVLSTTVVEIDNTLACRLQLGDQHMQLPQPHGAALKIGQPYRIRIYARDVSLTLAPVANSSVQNQLRCEIVGCQAAQHQAELLVELAVGKQTFLALITRNAWQQLQLQLGTQVIAHLKAAALHETLRETL